MRLSPVLADTDLSPVELQAARLDGEVYDLAGAYCLVGELEAPRHRARAVLGARSSRLIAELRTAAWIWGACEQPERLEFAVTPDARARLAPGHHIAVREIVYDLDDLATLDGCRATTPLRTILDLARYAQPFDPSTVTRLAAIGGLHLADCLTSLARRSGIPSKDRARDNLRLALTP
ncbi:type IV toxin-antitoxin system AbiEi family antitoxin [Pseudolysinimonas sp.]|uniref:type IV toxin-antitoxin system AbiEi family antitoxin n=1 Tax=Pseudolysinimonas sp. TaxID=2680009 RepID=UPI00286B7681|nr:type IV toxin-antitoxin system AbiEi family antitoxin [Pseudolysinimonas sp.]